MPRLLASRSLLALPLAAGLVLLVALACNENSEGDDSAVPLALTRAEGEAVLTGAGLTQADLPGDWNLEDQLDLDPTPFGFQPDIVNLLRELSYDAALFTEFSQDVNAEETLFVEHTLFLYPDAAAAREGFQVATAESAAPRFFGGWPRIFKDIDPSEVMPGPSVGADLPNAVSFSSTCPTPGRPEEQRTCTGVLAQEGSLLSVLVTSDPPPIDLVEITSQVSTRVAEELASALADPSAPTRKAARMTIQAEDVQLYEFSKGVVAHETGLIYEEAGKTGDAAGMGVLGGASVVFSDPHSRSRIINSVTVYESKSAAEDGFAFEDAEGRPPDIEGSPLDAGEEGLAYRGATRQTEGTSVTTSEEFLIIRLDEIVATIRITTPEYGETPTPASDIVEALISRIEEELDR